MEQAQVGHTVKVHYTGRLVNGTEFDTSRDDEPLEFTIGAGQIIPGFEDAVLGMSPGQSKTINIPTEEAYGPHQPEMVMVVNRQEFPDNITPRVGQELQVRQANRNLEVVVTAVSDTEVTLDANHPLAGQALVFDIELVEINQV
jgi:FKBP-type peptidyl-prolyl cis-trans isomerase 2